MSTARTGTCHRPRARIDHERNIQYLRVTPIVFVSEKMAAEKTKHEKKKLTDEN